MTSFRNGGFDEDLPDPRPAVWLAAAQQAHPARPPEVVAQHDVIRVERHSHSSPLHVLIEYHKSRPVHQSALNEVVARIAQRWALSESDVATLLGVESAELAADVIRGYAPLRGRDSEDRVASLFRIYEAVSSLFNDPDAEREWIRHPAEAFGDKSCLDRMLQGGIEDLVDVRRAVEHIVGR